MVVQMRCGVNGGLGGGGATGDGRAQLPAVKVMYDPTVNLMSIRTTEFTRTRLGTIELSNGRVGWDWPADGPVRCIDARRSCQTRPRRTALLLVLMPLLVG